MPISLNFYLDTRTTKSKEKEIELPIKLGITQNRKTAYLSTGIKVLPSQWKDRKVTKRPDKARLNDFLESFKTRVRNMIYDGRDDGRYLNMTAREIKDDIAERLGNGGAKAIKNCFLDAYDKFAEGRRSERTREIYRVTGRKIRELVPNSKKLSLDKINLEWLESFDHLLLAKGNNASTRSLDFRNIRAVLKDAQRHRIIKENPFDDFKIPDGESPDRALTLHQLQRFKVAQVYPWEQKYLDFFFLSFFLIGINTEDLLHLKQVEEGRINYIRSKTQKPLSIKVEPEALDLIKKYPGKKHLLNILDTYASTHNWTSKVDAALKEIAQRNGLPPVTMYWARHSWATIASADLGIEISTIADALGHQSEKRVTRIYIRRKDYSAVDRANRQVIDALFDYTQKRRNHLIGDVVENVF